RYFVKNNLAENNTAKLSEYYLVSTSENGRSCNQFDNGLARNFEGYCPRPNALTQEFCMLLTTFFAPNGQSNCAISYEEDEHWLQAVWHGYVDQSLAQRGAEIFLHHAAIRPSAFMLSDNSR